jgi:dephospho-CoA kinase
MGNSTIKIALTGKLRSGKDTVASYLSTFYDFRCFAFGNELKNAFHSIIRNVPREPKPRRAYIEFGQFMRQFDENVWVDAVFRNIESYLRVAFAEEHAKIHGDPTLKPRVIVTDVRQQNEYDALKSAGFTFIRVTAPEELRIARAQAEGDVFTAEDLRHETETLIDEFNVDYGVVNDGTTLELYEKLDAIMAELGVWKTA